MTRDGVVFNCRIIFQIKKNQILEKIIKLIYFDKITPYIVVSLYNAPLFTIIHFHRMSLIYIVCSELFKHSVLLVISELITLQQIQDIRNTASQKTN